MTGVPVEWLVCPTCRRELVRTEAGAIRVECDDESYYDTQGGPPQVVRAGPRFVTCVAGHRWTIKNIYMTRDVEAYDDSHAMGAGWAAGVPRHFVLLGHYIGGGALQWYELPDF